MRPKWQPPSIEDAMPMSTTMGEDRPTAQRAVQCVFLRRLYPFSSKNRSRVNGG
jgi:hypothetical protein